MNYFEESFKLHERSVGKIEGISKIKVEKRDDLSLVYSSGVAEAYRKIHENQENVYKRAWKGNFLAVAKAARETVVGK